MHTERFIQTSIWIQPHQGKRGIGADRGARGDDPAGGLKRQAGDLAETGPGNRQDQFSPVSKPSVQLTRRSESRQSECEPVNEYAPTHDNAAVILQRQGATECQRPAKGCQGPAATAKRRITGTVGCETHRQEAVIPSHRQVGESAGNDLAIRLQAQRRDGVIAIGHPWPARHAATAKTGIERTRRQQTDDCTADRHHNLPIRLQAQRADGDRLIGHTEGHLPSESEAGIEAAVLQEPGHAKSAHHHDPAIRLTGDGNGGSIQWLSDQASDAKSRIERAGRGAQDDGQSEQIEEPHTDPL